MYRANCVDLNRKRLNCWARDFRFDVDPKPIILELDINHSKELALKSILERLTQSDSEGLVVAGADYVIRAGLAKN